MRRKVTDRIREWAFSGRRTALVIRGARQTGKTYAAEAFCRTAFEHSLVIDFTRDEASKTAFDGGLGVDEILLRLSVIHPEARFVPNETILFFDEIQECPNARTALKSFAVDGRYRVIASGSLLGLGLREARLLPMGYVEWIDLGPMDFEEFLWALGVPEAPLEAARSSLGPCEPMDASLFESLSEYHRWYLMVGGMPAVVSSFVRERAFGPVRREQGKIMEDYRQDIRRYAGPGEAGRIEACLGSMPAFLARENKKFVYADVEGGGDVTYPRGFAYYSRALDWLSMAGLSLTCRNLTEPHMPLEERARDNVFKLYMLDTGILMSGYDASLAVEVMNGNPDVNRGAIAENAVASALSLQGRRLYHFSKDGGRIEVDFVTSVGGSVCAIEVKSGSNRACRSLNKVMDVYGTAGMMFETRNCFVDDKGVRHYPLFAASFMDAIDPPADARFDFSGVDALRERYGGRGPVRRPIHHQVSI